MAKELEPGRGPQLSQQELDLIERFQTAYNAIDRHLRKVLGKEKNAPFTLVVKEYARSKPSWAADADYLEKVGKFSPWLPPHEIRDLAAVLPSGPLGPVFS